jgi:hypothetical protein
MADEPSKDCPLKVACRGPRADCLAAAARLGLTLIDGAVISDAAHAEQIELLSDGRSYLWRERVWNGRAFTFMPEDAWKLILIEPDRQPPVPQVRCDGEVKPWQPPAGEAEDFWLIRGGGDNGKRVAVCLTNYEAMKVSELIFRGLYTVVTFQRLRDGKGGFRLTCNGWGVQIPVGWFLVSTPRDDGGRVFRAAFAEKEHAGKYLVTLAPNDARIERRVEKGFENV